MEDHRWATREKVWSPREGMEPPRRYGPGELVEVPGLGAGSFEPRTTTQKHDLIIFDKKNPPRDEERRPVFRVKAESRKTCEAPAAGRGGTSAATQEGPGEPPAFSQSREEAAQEPDGYRANYLSPWTDSAEALNGSQWPWWRRLFG